MTTTPSGTDETASAGHNTTSSTTTDKGGWILPGLLALLLVALVGLTRFGPGEPVAVGTANLAAWTPAATPTGETVGLAIDFGNGAKRSFAALPWRADMTVADLLAAARAYRPGIVYTQQGAGEAGFLQSLEGVANEGAGGRNWIYEVNGEHAHVGFCIRKLKPDAQVLWTFTDEQYNENPESDLSSGPDPQ